MKITITRSFERTRQIADFVPIKSYCEASVEIDSVTTSIPAVEEVQEIYSDVLDGICQAEVEKTLMGYSPCCVVCGGKQVFPRRTLTKEGLCNTCNEKELIEARQFKADNAKNKNAKVEKHSDQ
jgi:hypothetical protein